MQSGFPLREGVPRLGQLLSEGVAPRKGVLCIVRFALQILPYFFKALLQLRIFLFALNQQLVLRHQIFFHLFELQPEGFDQAFAL